VRPYEAEPGSAMELYRTWDAYAPEWPTPGRRGPPRRGRLLNT